MAFGAAKKKTVDPEEILRSAREAFYNYDPVQSRKLYDEYLAEMKKKKKAPEDIDRELERAMMMENMLGRVERIAIIDSIVVDADSFFKHYRLAPSAGKLVGGEAVRLPGIEMAYVPQNNTRILYSQADTSGVFVLMSADILDDGTVDHPAPLEGDDLSGGGNTEYPFLMSDGLTLYYANDGEGSLGGYDIFMTRSSDDGTLLQPQNVGMPYNSPYDDYLLAIDEETGAGWWATDRNQIPGKLTIYVFVPSDLRVNVAADDSNLVSLARIDNVALTTGSKDYTKLKDAIERIDNSAMGSTASTSFELPVGSTTRIYRRLNDFRSVEARKAMAQAIDARTEMQSVDSRLSALRAGWSEKNSSQGITILNLEQQLADAISRYNASINEAIAFELKALGEE